MNCREAISLLAKESDAPLEARVRSDLAGHLAHCDSCRRTQAGVAGALDAWRAETANVTVPDPELEWRAVRRRMRGGAETGQPTESAWWSFKPAWLVLPVAAAIAGVFFFPRPSTSESGSLRSGLAVARANSVEVPGGKSSTMVFVDDKSGWLIVWASDAGGE